MIRVDRTSGKAGVPLEQALAAKMHAGRIVRLHQHHDVAVRHRRVDLVGEVANTISGNARRVFGPDFMISVPVVVAGSAKAIQVPRNVKAYIIPLRWHKYEAALVVSLQGRGVV